MDSYPAQVVDMSFLQEELDLEIRHSQTAQFLIQPDSYQALPDTTNVHGTTTSLDDGFYRGLAMVLHPVDGTLDWGMQSA